jgi:hypothetical protein
MTCNKITFTVLHGIQQKELAQVSLKEQHYNLHFCFHNDFERSKHQQIILE